MPAPPDKKDENKNQEPHTDTIIVLATSKTESIVESTRMYVKDEYKYLGSRSVPLHVKRMKGWIKTTLLNVI